MNLFLPLAALTCVLLLPEASAANPTNHSRPNIVLILVEDMGSRVGAFGDLVAQTPNIDRLAEEGMSYTRTFTTAGVCAPSRAALITGMHQQSIGAQHMRTTGFGDSADGPLGSFSTEGPPYLATPPAHVKAFPELLRAAGYYTINNNKTDYQFGEPSSIWDENGKEAHWKNRPDGMPFFAMYSSNFTHESGMFREGYARNDYALKNVERNKQRLAGLDERTDPSDVEVPAFLPDTPEIRQDLAIHYDNIRLMDAHVGRLRDELEQAGLLDYTVLIWATDHGDGLPRAKRSIYDSGIHVPMVVRFPDGRNAGTTDEQLVSFVDLAPTILALAGAEVPQHLPGRNFITGNSPPREYVYAARDRLDELPDHSRAVRDKRYKYIRNYDEDRPFFMPIYYRENLASMAELRRLLASGGLPPHIESYFNTPRPSEELYDTLDDPHEVNNLAGEEAYADILQALRAELRRWQAENEDWSTLPETEMRNTRIWPNGIQPITSAATISAEASGNGRYQVVLKSDTGGASIEYRTSADSGISHWQLYTGPFSVTPGTRIESRAVRYGFQASEVMESIIP